MESQKFFHNGKFVPVVRINASKQKTEEWVMNQKAYLLFEVASPSFKTYGVTVKNNDFLDVVIECEEPDFKFVLHFYGCANIKNGGIYFTPYDIILALKYWERVAMSETLIGSSGQTLHLLKMSDTNKAAFLSRLFATEYKN